MRLHYPALLRVNIRRGRMYRPELHILTSENHTNSKMKI